MAVYLAVQMFLIYNIVLYSIHGVGQSEHFGNALYSVIWSMGSILPIFVIKLSDKWGYKESLIVAGIFQTLGFFILSFSSLTTLLIGTAMYGTGMVFAVSQNFCVLSHTMNRNFKGRFNIFLLNYVIMNAFAFAAGIISGYANVIGYAAVFRIGAILSFILLIFVLTLYNRAECLEGTVAWELAQRDKKEKSKSFLKLFGVGILTCLLLILFVQIANIINIIIDFSLAGTILFLIYLCITRTGAARKKLITFTIVSLFSMVFWTGYNIYTATGFIDLMNSVATMHGIAIQWVVSIDSGIIIFLGALVTLVLVKLEKNGVHFNGILRTIIGISAVSLGMFIIVLGFQHSDYNGISVYFVMLAIFCCAIGEIFTGSVGSALAGQCATDGLDGVLISIGFIIVGGTAAFSVLLSDWMLAAPSKNIVDMSHQFSYVIGVFSIICLVGAFILILLYKKLTNWAGFGKFYKKPE
jgi:dipeptide/tripeptide permease